MMPQAISLATADPANWAVSSLGGKEALVRRLRDDEVEAFAMVREATSDRVSLDDGALTTSPILDRLALDVRDQLFQGRGLVIIRGLDVAKIGEAGFRSSYWTLGRRIGTPAVQSERLERLGLVRQEKDNPFGRGFIQNIELAPHTDVHDVLSLASVTKASSGGESGFASALAVHDTMARERPDLLNALYQGFPSGIAANYDIDDEIVSVPPTDVPVYCNVDGIISTFVHGHYMAHAARARGIDIPELLQEAMLEMSRIAQRPEHLLEFMLEPGEMVFFNNRTVMHARRQFENAPGHERLLLRLWLHIPGMRPIHPEIARQPLIMDKVHHLVNERAAA